MSYKRVKKIGKFAHKVDTPIQVSLDMDRQDELLTLWTQACEPMIEYVLDIREKHGEPAMMQAHMAAYATWAKDNEHLVDKPDDSGFAARLLTVATGYVALLIDYGVFHR